MKKIGILIVVLALIAAIPPLRERVGSIALPVLERIGPAADIVVNPIRHYSAKNKVSHTLRVIQTDYNEGRRPPDSRDFHLWMKQRMPEETGLDPWGNPYWMQREGDRMTVGSNGVDGVLGTDDDVTSTVTF